MEGGNEGGTSGGLMDNGHYMPFKQDTINCTIRQRQYIEIESIDTSEECYFLPLDWLELYTMGLDEKGIAKYCPRWSALVPIAFNYGIKINDAGISMHSLIPLQDILKSESGTPIEQTTPNLQPYVEIMKDTNYQYNQLTFPTGTTLAKWLENPQKATLAVKGSAPNPESIINRMGSLETFKAGERKAYTMGGNTDHWFNIKNNGTSNTNLINYIPTWGGIRDWEKAPDANHVVANLKNTQVNHGIFMRMTPVKDTNGQIMKFRARITVEKFINFTLRMPPQAAPGQGPVKGCYNQHLQQMRGQTTVSTYTINHPF